MVVTPGIVTVKLVPATRAVTTGLMILATTVLQVTLNFVPREVSGCTIIWLFAVTAVVFTVTVVAVAAMVKDPADAEPQTAGDADDEQLVAVSYETAVAAPAAVTLNRLAPPICRSIRFPANPEAEFIPSPVPTVLQLVEVVPVGSIRRAGLVVVDVPAANQVPVMAMFGVEATPALLKVFVCVKVFAVLIVARLERFTKESISRPDVPDHDAMC